MYSSLYFVIGSSSFDVAFVRAAQCAVGSGSPLGWVCRCDGEGRKREPRVRPVAAVSNFARRIANQHRCVVFPAGNAVVQQRTKHAGCVFRCHVKRQKRAQLRSKCYPTKQKQACPKYKQMPIITGHFVRNSGILGQIDASNPRASHDIPTREPSHDDENRNCKNLSLPRRRARCP
jgi:hypothetical protein